MAITTPATVEFSGPRSPEEMIVIPKQLRTAPLAALSVCLARASAVLKASASGAEAAESWVVDAIWAAEGYIDMANMIVSHYQAREFRDEQ